MNNVEAPMDSAAQEMAAILARNREMTEELEMLRQLHAQVDVLMPDTTHYPSIEEKIEADGRSIYVGNVEYKATAEELEEHFLPCGTVSRVNIQCNKLDGHPKGYAYIEFANKETVNAAVELDGSLFKGRQLKVMMKRTNQPGQCKTHRPPRGMSNVVRGRGRGGGGRFPGGYGHGGRFPGGYGHRGGAYNNTFSRRGRDSPIFSASNGMIRTARRNSSRYNPY